MKQQLDPKTLHSLAQFTDLSSATYNDLCQSIQKDSTISQNAPSGLVRRDPRNEFLVLYNEKRGKRPHDNTHKDDKKNLPPSPSCPICQGNTTPAIDLTPLSEGYTFINKNMFPCVHVSTTSKAESITPQDKNKPITEKAFGQHYLQWTSTIHNNDWYNMPVKDLTIVLSRLAKLEKKLLFDSKNFMPSTSNYHNEQASFGFVSMIKNYGAAVGGSLVHGHQQIVHSNTMGQASFNNWNFLKRNKKVFSQHLINNTPKELILLNNKEITTVVPYFMKRPYNLISILNDYDKTFLYQLTDDQVEKLAIEINQITKLYHNLLPMIGRQIAYNILFHTGPGAGIYIEYLPFTQETGGLEQMGLWICQDTPENSAQTLKNIHSKL